MTVKNKDRKKRETVTADAAQLSFYQIFRYSTTLETLATCTGLAFGLISGSGIGYSMVLFGEISTAFVTRTAQQEQTSSRMPVLQFFGGGRRLTNASNEENMKALMEDGVALTLGTIAGIGLCLFFSFLSVWFVNWSTMKQMARIRNMFLKAVLAQDMSWYDTDTEFNFASKMSEEMMKLKDGMGPKLSVVANLVGTALVCFGQALPTGWDLALVSMILTPFSLISSIILTNYQTKSSAWEMSAFSKAGKQAEEILKSIRTVVAFAGEDKELDRYKQLLVPAERYGRKRGLYTGLGSGFNWIITFSLISIGLAYGTRLVLRDLQTPVDERTYVVGKMFSIVFGVYMGTLALTQCVPHMEAFSSAKAAAQAIFKLLERVPLINSFDTKGLSPRIVKGEITLEKIHFSYPARSDIKVLGGFSLNVKSGESVALVGSSGCGKSTILQLIQRLYDPQTGVVKLDNTDIKSLNIRWLRSSLGVVGQEPVLFRGTIFENISLGVPEATIDDVQKAAEIAYAHNFIVNLPLGYETVIGERGAMLSGGQKQRIAIARALLREPAVLLLDEATSALDPHSERQVQSALDRAAQGRTTLVVSHRLSTIVNCDRIICMDKGIIVEEGKHEELLLKKGFYWKLVTTGQKDTEDNVENLSNADEEEVSDIKDVSFMTRRKSTKPSLNDVVFEDNDENDMDEKIPQISLLKLYQQNAPEWRYLLVGSLSSFLQGACFPLLSIMFGNSLAVFSYTDASETLRVMDIYTGLFVVVAAFTGLFMCLQSSTFTSAGLKMTTRLRLQYFSSLLRQEIGYFDRKSNSVGALCSRLSGDAAEVQGATGIIVGLILQGISSIFFGFVIGMYYNWKMTLVGMAFLPMMVGSIWFDGKSASKSEVIERKALESAIGVATEAVVSIRTVQSLGVETVFLQKFQENLSAASQAISKKMRYRGLILGLGIYIPHMSFVFAVVYGITLVANEGVKYEVVILVNMAVMFGAYMLGQALLSAPSFTSAKACGSRILATINRTSTVKTADGVIDNRNWSATGSFTCKDLEFAYPTRPNQKVLKGIQLSVEAGKSIALVGSSGCGKSTILQLMQRFYDPVSGSIELDTEDIRYSLTLSRLRRQLGVVQQEPVLFDRTLGENIAYGDNSRILPMHEIIAAAKAANIHSFIVSLPKGYDTNLGLGGAQLSGGQKQRVCIARALVRRPRLLLLDEATSALDANSEKVVAEALKEAAKGRTSIAIAHRLSTIRDSDLICVVDKGTIIEAGTHEELMKLQKHYWKMSQGQHLA